MFSVIDPIRLTITFPTTLTTFPITSSVLAIPPNTALTKGAVILSARPIPIKASVREPSAPAAIANVCGGILPSALNRPEIP